MTKKGYMLTVVKEDRNDTPLIIRQLRKALFALAEYPGNLKIIIEVEDEV